MRPREKHPLWLRISHWLGVPTLALMIWSGLLIYWANDIYRPFFPDWFYKSFSINQRLAEGMAVHFVVGWIFVLNTLFYIGASFATRHWRELYPNRASWKNLLPTILHDFHLGRVKPPQGKYNAAQRFAYSAAALLLLIEVITGFAIYKPVQLSFLLIPFGGYEGARLVHFAAMLLLVAFIFLHLLQVARAGWNQFRAMVAGFEVVRDKK